MQTRLTTLETKWDTVIPTLATREDLLALEGRLRDDMQHRFIDLQRWMDSALQRWVLIALAVMSIGGGAGLVLTKRWTGPVSSPMSLSVEQPADTSQPAPAPAPADVAAGAGLVVPQADAAAGQDAENPA